MYFTKAAFVFSLATSTYALPFLYTQSATQKRAGVLQERDYADFQVSDGVAGNALAEVQAKFPIDESDLANIDPADFDILNNARVVAEDAEVGAGGFNDAIAAAGGADTPEGVVLQRGKIKNKVLKLKLEVLVLQIEAAQGNGDDAKIATEQTKLDTNIKLDEGETGKESQSVDFQESGAAAGKSKAKGKAKGDNGD